MLFYRISEASEFLGVTPQTLRNWDKQGKFKPDHRDLSGTRFYSARQIDRYLATSSKHKSQIGIVSTFDYDNDVNRLIDFTRGLGCSMKALTLPTSRELLNYVINNSIDVIYVMNTAMLFKYNSIGGALMEHGCSMVSLDSIDYDLEVIDYVAV